MNGYNKKIMSLFRSNTDLQICIDPYATGNYVCKYMTKAEAGQSELLHAISNEVTSLKQIDQLHAFANILDKHREMSIQETI